MGNNPVDYLKIIVSVSIFFAWVVRYRNILKEFKFYKISAPVRDLVGILKLSFSLMLMAGNTQMVMIGGIGIASLMLVAQFYHFRFKTSAIRRVPSLILFLCSTLIGYNACYSL